MEGTGAKRNVCPCSCVSTGAKFPVALVESAPMWRRRFILSLQLLYQLVVNKCMLSLFRRLGSQYGATHICCRRRRSAANPPAAIAAVDRWDRRTDGYLTVTWTLMRILSGPDLRGPRGPWPHAHHQQKVSHQTVHILFLANDRRLRDYDSVVAHC